MKAVTRFLVCVPESAEGAAVQIYSRYLHTLLGGQVSHVSMTAKDGLGRIKQAACDCDLVVFCEPEQSCLERVATGRPCLQVIDQVPTSLLVVRRPRQPIKQILLILRVEETDEAAVEWVGCLARPSDAVVTILPIVPSMPAMYSLGNRLQTGLGVLLSPNTPSGKHLRRIAQQLVCLQIVSDLHLRQAGRAGLADSGGSGQRELRLDHHWLRTMGSFTSFAVGRVGKASVALGEPAVANCPAKPHCTGDKRMLS